MAKLYFYYSAMNAGKSTHLLQSSYNYRERGMQTLILTPLLDHRAGVGQVASRIGVSAPAHAFTGDEDLLAFVRARHLETSAAEPQTADSADAGHGLACVLVDEAQFLSREQVYQLTEVVDQLAIPVLAYGLRTDFRGELFEGSQHLLAWADELRELKTICHTGRKATMVVRVDDQGRAVTAGQQVEIGGNERYISVSRREFKRVFNGQSDVEPAQVPLPLRVDD
ncbi:MAG: thymidine kinase [Pseudomonadota bacterium]